MVQILSEINLRMASELEERFLARPTSSKVGTELTKVGTELTKVNECVYTYTYTYM